MEKSGYNFTSWYFMSMSVYNLVGMRCHGIFYTCFISNFHQQWVSKGVVGLRIPIIGRVITIWDEVWLKIRVSVDGLVSRNKVFSEYGNFIETHIDVVVEVLEIQISVALKLYFEEELIELWWAGLMFEIPHATNFVECPPSNGGEFLLSGTTVVGY